MPGAHTGANTSGNGAAQGTGSQNGRAGQGFCWSGWRYPGTCGYHAACGDSAERSAGCPDAGGPAGGVNAPGAEAPGGIPGEGAQ